MYTLMSNVSLRKGLIVKDLPAVVHAGSRRRFISFIVSASNSSGSGHLVCVELSGSIRARAPPS